jgi:hypothetical protein
MPAAVSSDDQDAQINQPTISQNFMKKVSRFGLIGILTIGVAALVALLLPISSRQNSAPGSPAAIGDALQYSEDLHTNLSSHRNTKAARKKRQTPVQWLAALSESKGSIHEKLAQLQAELPRHNVIALWTELILAGTWVSSGQLPGSEKWESEMIFNALLDALVEAGSAAQTAGLPTEAVASIFSQLINAPHCDGVLRDYSIQRGLILTADSLPPENPDRQAIISTVLDQLTTENLNEFHAGTALNTFLSFQDQWSPSERDKIQARIEHLISSLPKDFIEDRPQVPDGPSLEVCIPLITAIGGWEIQSALPLLRQAIRSGRPSLQIPAIAAWSRLPQKMRETAQLQEQIETWATSQSPLQYAASNAIRVHTSPKP